MLGPATVNELSGTRPRWRAASSHRPHGAAGRRSIRKQKYTVREHTNHFYYDALLRRYAVEDSSGVRYFTWDSNGMNLLAERDATGNVVASYTHGRTAVDGIGSCVGQKLVQSSQTYYEFDICDHRGSVVRRVNAAGQVTGYFEYDAWGNYLRDEEVGANTRFRYQSNWIELKDSDGELYLSPTRVYHAGVGRFLGRDHRIGQIGRYEYCRGLTTFFVDPDGRAEAAPGTSEPIRKGFKFGDGQLFYTVIFEHTADIATVGHLGVTVTGVIEATGECPCKDIDVVQYARTTATSLHLERLIEAHQRINQQMDPFEIIWEHVQALLGRGLLVEDLGARRANTNVGSHEAARYHIDQKEPMQRGWFRYEEVSLLLQGDEGVEKKLKVSRRIKWEDTPGRRTPPNLKGYQIYRADFVTVVCCNDDNTVLGHLVWDYSLDFAGKGKLLSFSKPRDGGKWQARSGIPQNPCAGPDIAPGWLA
jgi:RHS repeat-associated protein